MDSPALHLFRGTLTKTIDESRPMHNAFSEGGPTSAMAIARSLGDLSHNVYMSVSDDKPPEVLLLDFWADMEGMKRFFSDKNVQEAGARLCSSYDETSWTPARQAFSFHLPPVSGQSARFVAMVRVPVRSVEDAVAELNRFVSKNAGVGRRRGLLSHDLYVRLGPPDEPAEILGIDFWSNLDGLVEHYDDEKAWRGLDESFTRPQAGSVWTQANGFVEW